MKRKGYEMNRAQIRKKVLGKELKVHLSKGKMQTLLRGEIPMAEMLIILEHTSKCQDCYKKLMNEIARPKPKNSQERR